MLPALPAAVRAGDTLADTFELDEYPATTWSLVFTLINASAKYTATCTASGASHALAVPASTTASWAPGAYSWTAHVASGANRYTVASGSIQVQPNLAAASTYDTRSAARKALDAAEAALATYGAKAYLQSIEYGERRQQFASPGDFLAFVSRLRAMVRTEDNAARLAQGLAPRNRLLVRFR